ncbi:MAG: C39 family peptidase [Candidatus Thiodiazotropha sp.]
MVKKLFLLLVISYFSLSVEAGIKNRVQLEVPLVKQGKSLCGPATIEMLFRYWGVDQYSQYDIARSLLNQFPTSKRYKDSGILSTDPIDWDKYPGTGTINMREFLKRFGKTVNIMLEHESVSESEKIKQKKRMFQRVKKYLSDGIPVIVHQYWKLPKSRGHYRIVTGYDEFKKVVYLNDANPGKMRTQSYEKFMKLWNFDQRWLHYNAIAFNIERRLINIKL